MARIITITSGKGGVGKTSISLNLSLSLALKGFKVCLFDADLGLANVNILTGLYPEKGLEDVISGDCNLSDILISNYQGIDIIPGSSGVEKLADLTQQETMRLVQTFIDLDEYDYFIFDTSAGISSQVISFCMASHEIILVATCEPTSLTDAYAMLKVLSKHEYPNRIKIIVNQVKSGKAAKHAYGQLKTTTDKFLDIAVEPLGIIAVDKNVKAAVVSQTPFCLKYPDTVASKCIKNIVSKVIQANPGTQNTSMAQFWTECLSFISQDASPHDAVPESHDNRSLSAVLENIESKLQHLTNDICEIKTVLAEQNNAATPKPALRSVQPSDNVLDFERSAILSPIPASFIKAPKKRKPIVRGQLRNPTKEELAHWDENENPVIVTHQSG